MSATSGWSRDQTARRSAEHVLPFEIGVADEPVARRDVLVDGARERAVSARSARSPTRMPRRPILSSYAGPMPRDVVPIFRSPRRASASNSISRWYGRIRCALSLTSRRPVTSMPIVSSSSSSANSACGSTTTPLPMMQMTLGWRMPDGIRCRTNFRPLHVHRVTGVVSALIPRDDAKMRRQQIDDLALALIAPLGAQHTQIHAASMIPFVRDGAARRIVAHAGALDRSRISDEPVGIAPGAMRAWTRRAPWSTSTPRAARRSTASTPDSARSPTSPFPPTQLAALQLNLIRSHAAGVGDPLPVPVVRALMALRANVLAKGFSGIRRETLDALVALLNAGVHPRVPVARLGRRERRPRAARAPGAGAGRRRRGRRHGRRRDRRRLSGADALARAGLRPVALAPKEGLALINGTQASAAVLALAVLAAERLARVADIAAAMSVDALRGSFHPFEARIHAARPVPGQAASAANLWRLGQGSAINESHENCGKVQDAYALRCAPQVHGIGARSHRLRAPARRDRSQQRHRQPDGLRRRRRHRVRRQLPRRARRPRGRHARDRPRAARDDQRAPRSTG